MLPVNFFVVFLLEIMEFAIQIKAEYQKLQQIYMVMNGYYHHFIISMTGQEPVIALIVHKIVKHHRSRET